MVNLQCEFRQSMKNKFLSVWAPIVAIALAVFLILLLWGSATHAFNKPRGGSGLQIFTFNYAVRIATDAPPPRLPPPGQSLSDLRQQVAAAHASNPPEALVLARAPKGAMPIFVSIEDYHGLPITHYVFQASYGLAHLFIVNQIAFRVETVTSEIYTGDANNFRIQVWNAGGYLFVELTPLGVKSPAP